MKKLVFSVSTGYVGSKREETFTLEELGIEGLDLEEQEKRVEVAFQNWLWENIDVNYYMEEIDK